MLLELAFLGAAAYDAMTSRARRRREANPSVDPQGDADLDHRFAVSSVNLGVGAVALANPLLTPIVASGVVYTSFPVFKRAVTGLVREGRVGNDLLILLSMVMFTVIGYGGVTAIGAWFYFLGSQVQRRARDQARARLSELFLRTPRMVWLVRDGVEVSVPLDDVRRDDVVAVRAGEVVPIDGIVTRGEALIDQHQLTGESQPAEKGVDDEVFASTVLLSGALYVRVQRTGYETTTARIADALDRAVNDRPDLQLKGEQWADRVALPLLATAGAALAVLGPVPSSIVLASGIGNRIRLFGPLATLTYLDLASGCGFLVKDGRALEQLRGVDTVLFDKTGTLTRNWFVVSAVATCGAWTERELIGLAALAEGRETHPIARGVLAKAAELGIEPADADRRRYHFGFGIAVEHEGRRVEVGSARFMRREHIAIEPLEDATRQAEEEGHPLVFVAVNGELAGAIELEAAVRSDLPDMIAGLRRRGVTLTAIVSGDHAGATAAIAQQLGVDRAIGDLTPAGKADVVEQLQREGRRICFIGDGVNDALAMAKADVSISVQGASSFALDAAQIVMMDADRGLASLERLFDMAHALDRNLKNSLRIAIATAAVNVNAALFIEGYGVLTAIAVRQTGLAAGLGNAMLLPRATAAAKAVHRNVTARLA